ncbi:MAG: hypothetical protein ACRDS9_00730 [Pseudonocardiaceae bacterium]
MTDWTSPRYMVMKVEDNSQQPPAGIAPHAAMRLKRMAYKAPRVGILIPRAADKLNKLVKQRGISRKKLVQRVLAKLVLRTNCKRWGTKSTTRSSMLQCSP